MAKRTPLLPYSLRPRMMAMLGTAMAFLLLIISTTVFIYIYRAEQEAWRGRQQDAAFSSAKVITEFIERNREGLNLIAHLDPQLVADYPFLLEEMTEHFPALLEIIVVNPGGVVIANTYQDMPLLVDQFTTPQSAWFAETRQGGTYMGSVRITASNEPYLIMAVPTAEGGAVAARISMSRLWDVNDEINFGMTGRAYIVETAENGRVIAHPNREVVLSYTTLQGRPEMAAALAAPEMTWRGTYTNLWGEHVTGLTMPISGTPWLLFVEVSRRETIASTRTSILLLSAAMLLVATLITLAIRWALIQVLFDPISALEEGVRQFGEGDPSRRLSLEGPVEIRRVAAAFNEMAENLARRTRDLAAESAARERAQAILIESEARYRAIIDDQTELICRFLPDGSLTFVNQAYCRYFDKTPEELLGRSFVPMIPESDQEMVQRTFGSLSRENPVVTYEHRVINPQGQIRWQQWTDRAIFDEEGKLVEYQAVGRDITALKEIQAMKDAFVSNVSHELRTPLANIRLYLDLLTKRPERQAAYLDTLHRETGRLQRLVEDLLLVSRLELKEEPLKRRPLDVNSLLGQYLDDRTAFAYQKGLTIAFAPGGHLPPVSADPMLLGLAFSNLLTNAINYTPSGGAITVRSDIRHEEERSWVTIAISDTGPGIPPDEEIHLFERFFRGRASRQQNIPGTGLGLAITREIVERHGGRVSAHNNPGGIGASFIIWLPPSSGESVSMFGLAENHGSHPLPGAQPTEENGSSA
ncbi:MAG: hypothetical protein Kow00124_09340 [Anaerolineae bacterium]